VIDDTTENPHPGILKKTLDENEKKPVDVIKRKIGLFFLMDLF
jgi:hypothetical protein